MESSQIRFIDTHCHLYAPDFDHDRTEMVRRAIDAGVQQMMLPNIDAQSIISMRNLVEEFPLNCFPMMGLHPCSVKEDFQKELDIMKPQLKSGNYVGIGETGIDLYWDTKFKDFQIEAFEQQINWAKEFDLPIIIHSRESLDLTIEIIERHQDDKLRGIFHCFGGDYLQGMRIYEMGFKVGIGGVVTFKKSGLDELLPQLPKSMLVLETDAPYLAPSPYRGKRNEAAYLTLVAERVALSLSSSVIEVARLTYLNACDVFRKMG